MIGALVIAIVALRSGLGGGAYLLALLVVVGGLGVALAASRRSTDEEMFRVAGMRFAASIAMLLAVFQGMRAVDIGNRIEVFAADGQLLATQNLVEAIELFTKTVDPGFTIGFVALFVAVIVAFFGFFSEIGEVAVRYTVFDMFAVVALMLGVGFLRIFESMGFSSVYVVATNLPAVEMYEELGAELPAAVVARDDESQVVRLADGGFGDVIANQIGAWTRVYRWNGTRWKADGYPLDEVEVGTERPALIAVDRGTDAEEILPLIEKAGGKAFLLLRASEVKAGEGVPPEVARLQTTFLPVRLSDERDLKTQLWLPAGSPEANWGPTTWYGAGDDSLDAMVYAAAALSDSQATGVNLAVKGRKVGDVVSSCLPYLLEPEGGLAELIADLPKPGEAAGAEGAAPAEGEATPSEGEGTDDATADAEGSDDEADGPSPLHMSADRWCALTAEEPETLREEAAGVWDVPKPDNVSMSVATEGPIADKGQAVDRLRRELGGLSYCATQAVAAGEEVKGRMSLQLALSKDGRVYDTLVNEKSQVQSPAMLRCASKRFRKLEFELVPQPEPAAGEEAPAEPPVQPKVMVDLDLR
ncbi:MAG: hypothetical protein R3F59_06220 [Myxococcota bacterium]